jgi:hypothetical protein
MAHVFNVDFAWLSKRIKVTEFDSEPVDVPVQHDINIAKRAMEDVGLKNVGGGWQSAEDAGTRAYFRLNKSPGGISHHILKRKDCDRCEMHFRDLRGTNLRCERDGTSDTCKRCKKFGMPCSWTDKSILLGPALGQTRKEAMEEVLTDASTRRFRQVLLEWDSNTVSRMTDGFALRDGMDFSLALPNMNDDSGDVDDDDEE